MAVSISWQSQIEGIADPIAREQKMIELYRAGQVSDVELWKELSGYNSNFSIQSAKRIYEGLGFMPFAGYPLKKIRVTTE